MSQLQRILNLVLLPLIILAAYLIVKIMIAGKPERKPKEPSIVVPRVEYISSSPQNNTPTIHTFGNTQSFYQAQLAAQVSGIITAISHSFQPGTFVQEGELLLQIDDADYLALVAQAEASLATAQQTLSEENTRSQLAIDDWIDSGRDLKDASDFSLRKPQLIAAQASLKSAQANLDKAQLDLQRTRITAPFDAIIASRDTSPGNIVSGGTLLGSLIARHKAEVSLPLTPQQITRLGLSKLQQISPDDVPLIATLTSPNQPDNQWTATVTRILPTIDPQNQVRTLIAEIEEPFAQPDAPLPIGAFVNAELAAPPIAQSHRLPQTALVQDQYIWIIDPQNQLQKQAVTRLASDGAYFFATIDKPLAPYPLKVATRTLASFLPQQTVVAIASAPQE